MFLILFASSANAQFDSSNEVPYDSIGEYPISNNANGILKRLIYGLGYRLHWATKDLREEDQMFKYEGEGNRSIAETMEHVYDLSNGILAFAKSEPMSRADINTEWKFEDIRRLTLQNLKQASNLVSSMSEQELFELKIQFKRGDQLRDFELWHIINGQISDAIYHTGQIVALRRASGNPLSPNVSVFMGKNRS